jgi:hypothetical protein
VAPPRPQADRQELAEYEQQSAAARSKGLFFKTLYQPDKGEVVGDVDGAGIDRQVRPGGGVGVSSGAGLRRGGESGAWAVVPAAAGAGAASDPRPLPRPTQRLEQTRSAVVAPAEEEVASPLRFYLFSYMTAVLLFFTAWGAHPPAFSCSLPPPVPACQLARQRLPASGCPRLDAPAGPAAAADLLISDSPSLGLDAINAALAAILGLNLFNERKLLVEQGLRQQGGGDAGSGDAGSGGGGGSGSQDA